MKPFARHGYTLILAIVLIGAVGFTLVVMGRNFVMTTRSVRSAELEARTAQLLAGGRAWVVANPPACESLAAGDRIDLPVDSLIPEWCSATLTVARNAGDPALIVTAMAQTGIQCSVHRIRVRP